MMERSYDMQKVQLVFNFTNLHIGRPMKEWCNRREDGAIMDLYSYDPNRKLNVINFCVGAS
jgi:hypothetical protein